MPINLDLNIGEGPFDLEKSAQFGQYKWREGIYPSTTKEIEEALSIYRQSKEDDAPILPDEFDSPMKKISNEFKVGLMIVVYLLILGIIIFK